MNKPRVEIDESVSRSEDGDADAERWRLRLLPLMTRMLVGLTVFFFVISLAQITYLHWRVGRAPTIDLSMPIGVLMKVAGGTAADGMLASNAVISAQLEASALDRRYHQANVVLMARVWTSYMGFMTGMILALVGAVFILGRLPATPTEIEGKSHDTGAALKTSAPGIVLVSLGVVMMLSTLFVRYEISVRDSAIYSRSSGASAIEPDARPPLVRFPSTTPTDSAAPNTRNP